MTKEPTAQDRELAAYILEWLVRRNRGQLRPAIEAMTVVDHRLLREELEWILAHGGHPPNWVPHHPDVPWAGTTPPRMADDTGQICGADDSIPFEHSTLGQTCPHRRPCPKHPRGG